MSRARPQDLQAFARALDVDARDLRQDTPLATVGWTGTATDWLLLADHLGVELRRDPDNWAQAATIGDAIAMVLSASGTR